MTGLWCEKCFALHKLPPADIERIVYALELGLRRAWRDPFYLRPDARCLRETLERSRDDEHADRVDERVVERRRDVRMDGVFRRLGVDGIDDPSLGGVSGASAR